MEKRDPLTSTIIGTAIEVSKLLGNGLLESAYQAHMVHKLRKLDLNVRNQPGMPVFCDGIRVKLGFRPDLIVENRVIVELKTIRCIQPVHKAQLLTYLRFADLRVGLLINFHAYPFSEGIVRMVL
jgi:GxxExxY protein